MSHSETAARLWRSRLPVLVMEGQTLGAIAAIRSLGRAGYPVHACAPRADALGLLSNYANVSTICPDYEQTTFPSWLREYVQQWNIRAIVPSEGLLLALRAAFSDFTHLLPFSDDATTVYAGINKFDVFALLANSGKSGVSEHLPPTLLLEDFNHVPSIAELEKLGTPLYIKADGYYSLGPRNGAVYKFPSAIEAQDPLRKLASRFHRLIIQGYVPGQGVGVFLLLWDGQLIAEFMHRRLHEVPHTGGVSSFRESWFHAKIRNDALAKLKYLGWQGVAMMEYRWDAASDQFYLMEMNGRFWGSLHLALYAGVDFPVLLLDAFHGHLPNVLHKFRLGVQCRHTFPKEIEYVWSRLKDRELALLSRLWSVVEFFQLALNPRIYSDLLFPGDRKLYWKNLRRFLWSFMRQTQQKEQPA